MKASGWDFIDHMIEDCEDILTAQKETPDKTAFITNRIIHKSVTYSLLNLGELMKSFNDAERESFPQIPWKRIIGFRDRTAHGYHSLNLDIVWEITQTLISPLLEVLKEQKGSKSE